MADVILEEQGGGVRYLPGSWCHCFTDPSLQFSKFCRQW